MCLLLRSILQRSTNIRDFKIVKYFLNLLNKREDKKRSKYYQHCIAWKNNKGYQTHRLDYDLDEDSLVFDAGGYEGQWTSDIFSKYCCKIFVFDPVKQFANNIQKRFSKNKKIVVYNFGLSNKTYKTKISVDKDSSSLYKNGNKLENVDFVRLVDFIKERNINRIDLLKLNIEGAEFDLLEDLINSGDIKKIRNIQVSFHEIVPNAGIRMKKIQSELKKTHFLTYQYLFVFENWQIRE